MKKIWEECVENGKVRDELVRLGCAVIKKEPGERNVEMEGLNIEVKEPLLKILYDVCFQPNLIYMDKDKDQDNPWEFIKGGEIEIIMFDEEISKNMKKKNVGLWMWKNENVCCLFDLESKEPANPNIIIYDIKDNKELKSLKFSDFLAELEPYQLEHELEDDEEGDGNGDGNNEDNGEDNGGDVGNDDNEEGENDSG